MATIYCDESGFSGNNLYHDPAPFFTYAGVAIEPEAAEQALLHIKGILGYHQGEIKYSSLAKKERGIQALDWLLDEHRTKAKVWFAHKKFAACAKFFEYVIEPVISDYSYIFYQHGFHQFISNLLYVGIHGDHRDSCEMVADAQKMIRDRDTAGLKRLLLPLSDGVSPMENPYEAIAVIAAKHRDRIAEEMADLVNVGESGSWTMDLTLSAFVMVIRSFATTLPNLTVVCDTSKPLQVQFDIAQRVAEADFGGIMGELGWPAGSRAKLDSPINIVKSSVDMPGIQLADLFAGMTREVLTNGTGELAKKWWQPLWRDVILPSSLLHNEEHLNFDKPIVRVNVEVLRELARRAVMSENLVEGMGAYYGQMKRFFRVPGVKNEMGVNKGTHRIS
jgi:hypothetical protein